MSTTSVLGLQDIFESAYGATEQFIDVCPDEIWSRSFGGWPIWQHVYHSLLFTELFALDSKESPEKHPLSMEVAVFAQTPDTPWSKYDAREFAMRVRTQAEAYFAVLTDADLDRKHGMLSQFFKKDMPQTAAASIMAGHVYYHLGVCDAALREQGLKGIL